MRIAIVTATTLSMLALSLPVQAATYVIESYPNRDKCYSVKHVPAKVEVNTKGIFVKAASKSVIGSYEHGGRVVFRNTPAVYVQTERVLEEDHISLIPTGC